MHNDKTAGHLNSPTMAKLNCLACKTSQCSSILKLLWNLTVYTLGVLFGNYHIVECSFLRPMLHKSCVVCVFVAMLVCIPDCVLVLHNQLLTNSFTFHQIHFMLYIPLNHSNRNVYPSASAGLTCPQWNVSLSQVPPSYIIIARFHCPTQINP